MPDFTTSMVAMIGLGVGIDYALFIVTAIPGEPQTRRRASKTRVVASIDTSGRAVLFAGITVIISLLGLLLIGLGLRAGRRHRLGARRGHDDRRLAHLAARAARLGRCAHRQHHVGGPDRRRVRVVGAFVGVTTGQSGIFLGGFLLAILFFALSFAVKPLRRLVPHRREKPQGTAGSGTAGAASSSTGRAERFVAARRSCCCSPSRCSRSVWVSATPATARRTQTVRKAYDMLAEGFGPGTNGPLFVTVQGETASDPKRSAPSSRRSMRSTTWRSACPTPIAHDDLALVIVYPQSAPQDEATTNARQRPARRRDPRDWRRREGRRLHRRLDRLRRLPRRPHALADRRRAACSASCC